MGSVVETRNNAPEDLPNSDSNSVSMKSGIGEHIFETDENGPSWGDLVFGFIKALFLLFVPVGVFDSGFGEEYPCAQVIGDATSDQILQDLVQLKTTFAMLLTKVASLEDLVRNVHGNNGKDWQKKKVSDVATQTDKVNMFTSADIATRKQPTNHQSKTDKSNQTVPLNKIQNKEEKRNQQTNIDKKANDAKKFDDVKKSTTARNTNGSNAKEVPNFFTSPNRKVSNQHKKSNNKDSAEFPTTFLIHDSTMNNIDQSRLGLSYGSNVMKRKAYTVDAIESAVDSLAQKAETSPDAIIIHCGLNDLRNKNTIRASKDIVQSIKNIKHKHPHTNIIISKIIPTYDKKIEADRTFFNDVLTAELFGRPGIVFASHENILKNKIYIRKDNIHPTKRGTSVLAGNIGRAMRDTLWEIPRQRGRSGFQHHHNKKIYTDYNTSWWNNPYNVLYEY